MARKTIYVTVLFFILSTGYCILHIFKGWDSFEENGVVESISLVPMIGPKFVDLPDIGPVYYVYSGGSRGFSLNCYAKCGTESFKAFEDKICSSPTTTKMSSLPIPRKFNSKKFSEDELSMFTIRGLYIECSSSLLDEKKVSSKVRYSENDQVMHLTIQNL